MTKEEIIEGLKLLEDNMVYFDELQNDKGKWIDVHELLFEAIQALSQEPCDDAVSREAILSKIKEVCFSKEWTQFRVNNGSHGQRDFLINYIEQLPSITQRSGKWILVSERLPDEFESVLVCYKSQGGMAQAVSERFGTHTGYRWSALAGIKPIAWMPLPKPYEPQESEVFK